MSLGSLETPDRNLELSGMLGQGRLPRFKQDLLTSRPESKRETEGTGVLNPLQGPNDLKTLQQPLLLKPSALKLALSVRG